MLQLSLFWIREEFAKHYFHKSDLLYAFLREYKKEHADQTYNRQFDFITKDIPFAKISRYLHDKLKGSAKVHIGINHISIEHQNLQMAIQCDRKEWTILCSSMEEAELMLFEYMRGFHTSFFVMDVHNHQYGWLAPIKKEIIL
ncbi:sporulation inhibitor of replication protein SirA [Salirhabdus salicampi]|uniref:sporulation inhibitor of replication protein SirA n=1 Tax=Salirhabdus salicampi TaxID=476102 RepID=UPI0020C579A6|nr:sporulation inhibitor of replication protein SirA [Salirhabdus salicampi]MCP8616424.1 sporulation inhibitor of replication protein SirA [Salirhabdus salicampi]